WRGTSYSFAAQPLAGRRDRHSCPHDALPIFSGAQNGRRRPLSPVPSVHRRRLARRAMGHSPRSPPEVPLTCPFPPCRRLPLGNRSAEHTSALQSRENLVCRLLLEKKNRLTST